MLYDGAIRYMEAGRAAVKVKDYNAQNRCLQGAQNIVTELMCCLDMEKGGEISENLFSLYSFVLQQLIDANVKDLVNPIDVSIKIFENLRSSWIAIDEQQRSNKIEQAIAA